MILLIFPSLHAHKNRSAPRVNASIMSLEVESFRERPWKAFIDVSENSVFDDEPLNLQLTFVVFCNATWHMFIPL